MNLKIYTLLGVFLTAALLAIPCKWAAAQQPATTAKQPTSAVFTEAPEVSVNGAVTGVVPFPPIELSPSGAGYAAGPAFGEVLTYSPFGGGDPTGRPGCCDHDYCHLYFRGEYLAWWLTGDNLPPLVTTSPSSTPRDQAGVLGEPGTTVLFGDETVNEGVHSGGRFVFGMCLSPIVRLEGEYFALGSLEASFNQASDGSTILARPFFNLFTDAQDANLAAYPEELAGTINAGLSSQFMGAGIHLSYLLSQCESCDGYTRIDFLYGFRWLGLYQRLQVNSSTTAIDPLGPFPVGTNFTVNDYFGASSNFYGANLGGMIERRRGRWSLSALGWLGLGGTSEQVSINGRSRVTQPDGDTENFDGGLLALPTNIGQYSSGGFTVVPHLELKAAYLFTPSLRWTIGYDLMYWSRVVRAADQVDLNVNPSQSGDQPLIGLPGPLFTLDESDLFIHGLSTGVEWRY